MDFGQEEYIILGSITIVIFGGFVLLALAFAGIVDFAKITPASTDENDRADEDNEEAMVFEG